MSGPQAPLSAARTVAASVLRGEEPDDEVLTTCRRPGRFCPGPGVEDADGTVARMKACTSPYPDQPAPEPLDDRALNFFNPGLPTCLEHTRAACKVLRLANPARGVRGGITTLQ